jgi:peptide chain release factor 1
MFTTAHSVFAKTPLHWRTCALLCSEAVCSPATSGSRRPASMGSRARFWAAASPPSVAGGVQPLCGGGAPVRHISTALAQQLTSLEARNEEIQAKLMAPDVDPRTLGVLGREAASLGQVLAASARWRAAASEAEDLQSVLREAEGSGGGGDTAELVKMAKSELETALPAVAAAENALIRLLLPVDEANQRDAILEFRAGVGGEEAALFAGEMYAMYEQYAKAAGWGWQPMFSQKDEGSDGEGLREGVVSVTGPGVYGRLRHESGVHRVQRVPTTQSTGKLQTSTMTVAVLPEAEEVDVTIVPADLRIETYRSGGAGGQSVNKTDSAVRITHIPSGVVVAIQDERSQLQNRVKAMRVLRARLFEEQREKLASARSKDRKSQIGSSARSDRVRTYNYAQNRVTDHRVGISKFDVERFMRGEDLDEVFNAMDEALQDEALAALEAGIAVVGKAV